MERATLLDKIGNATEARDRCLKLLGLDKRATAGDIWDEYHRNAALPGPLAQSPASDARAVPDCRPAESTPERQAQSGYKSITDATAQDRQSAGGAV